MVIVVKEKKMITGQMMIYIGIGLCAVGLLALISLSIVFSKKKDALIKKIYE